MLLKSLILFLWLICIAVAVTATIQAATGSPDGNWFAAIFWWAVVVGAYILDRKSQERR